jgi:GT2 family glycosyltransferase
LNNLPDGPAISVVVPVFEHWEQLSSLYDALVGQVCQDFELIIVDNGSERQQAVEASVPSPLRVRTRVLHCPTPGSYAARNAGALVAQGKGLAFTDADCLPEPGWTLALHAALSADPGWLLAGPVRMWPGDAPNRWAIFDAVRGIPQEAYIRRGYATTANLAVSRAVFEALGGFDPLRRSGGDAEFCQRALGRGVPLLLVPAAVVRHPTRASWDQLSTKARRVKGGQVAAGPYRRRLLWTLRSLIPPLHEIARYLSSDHPWSWRLAASGVRFMLWRVEVAELARLLVLRREPERR